MFVGRKVSLRPTFCQLDGEGGSEVKSESGVGQGVASSPASSPPPPPPATAKVVKVGSKWRCWSTWCLHHVGPALTPTPSTTCQHVRHLQQGGGSAASWEYLSWVGHCHSLLVVFFNALVCDQYHTKYKYTEKSVSLHLLVSNTSPFNRLRQFLRMCYFGVWWHSWKRPQRTSDGTSLLGCHQVNIRALMI